MIQEEVISQVSKLSLRPNDVLVLRTSGEVHPHQVLHMVERLARRGLENLVFVVGDDSDICLFDEQHMTEWGWVRARPARSAEPGPFVASRSARDTEHLGAGS